MFRAGFRYSDASGDMDISFLDVVAFQATVDEESQILDVILQMRDIPSDAPRGQVKNLIEYAWTVFIFLDPSQASSADIPGDYYFALNTSVDNPFASGGEGRLTPVPGTPVTVPINQLFENTSILDARGWPASTPQAVANPDTDTLIMSGRVPGITSDAVFSFAISSFGNMFDRPDNYVAPELEELATSLPEEALARDAATELIPAGNVRAYPGPEHYAGDVLTFEIPNDGSFGDETVTVSMTLDGEETTEFSVTSSWLGLLLPLALDTSDLSGEHSLKFTTADGRLNETYSFNVLPAEERPANERNPAWLVNEIDCCALHYISGTAAARDIEYIAEHFQQAAEDFSAVTGSNIDPKLNVYIMDRMWGNGGFGGNGVLVVSYTDRYYGPTVGTEGLESLARHEFTHAAGIGLDAGGHGVDFNSEGLAVYVARGHYKPEPLAERGAALYDLGYYVPVGEFLGQHELDYLYPAAMLTYIVETYGMEKMWQFLSADDNLQDDQPGSLDAGLQSTLGVSLQNFDRAFQAWLENHDPGEQLDDLRLTIELQDLRREYQNTYAPPPNFIWIEAPDAAARPEYLPTVIRETRTPTNIAVELIIAHAQQAIVDGDYVRAEELNQMLAEILSTREFDHPLAKDYLDIVSAAANAGYEVVNLDIQGDRASTRVTADPPRLLNLQVQKIDGDWVIQQ